MYRPSYPPGTAIVPVPVRAPTPMAVPRPRSVPLEVPLPSATLPMTMSMLASIQNIAITYPPIEPLIPCPVCPVARVHRHTYFGPIVGPNTSLLPEQAQVQGIRQISPYHYQGQYYDVGQNQAQGRGKFSKLFLLYIALVYRVVVSVSLSR